MTSARVVYQPRADATPEAELNVLAAVFRYVLFDSQASKGGSHVLTENPTPNTVKNGPRTKEQENT